jgi:Leucine-rich repeat (LRR) protein
VTRGSGFYSFCTDSGAAPDVKATVSAVRQKLTAGADCAAQDTQLLAMTKLDLSGAGVSNLAPLAGMRNLTSLDLSGNAIQDLTPLRGLYNLRTLVLNGNAGLTNLSPLGYLSLTSLSVTGDPVGSDPASCPYPTLNEQLDRFCADHLTAVP